MKLTLEETEEFLNLPADTIIQVEVVSVELREQPFQKLNFRFKILDIPTDLTEQYAVLVGSTIFGSVGARLTSHPNNKLRQWVEALLNIGDLEPGFELDTDMLVGRRCRAIVDHYTKKDKTTGSGVGALLPPADAQPATVSAGNDDSAFPGFLGDEPPF